MKSKYKFWDLVGIPFKTSPILAGAILVNIVINALLPAFQVLVIADFVDTALKIFEGAATQEQIYTPLLLIMAIIAYQYLSGSVISVVQLKLTMKLNESLRIAIVEKRSRLEYSHVENNDTWELISRVCTDPALKIIDGYGQILGALNLIIRVGSVLMIVITQVWWAGLLIIAISVPLFAVSIKAGKTNYEAYKDGNKYTRRAEYLGKVLSERDYTEERSLFGYTPEVTEKWFEKYETARKINLKVTLKNFIRMKASSIITVFISLGIIGVLIPALGSGVMSIGIFIGIVSATLNLVQMMSWQLSFVTSELAKAREYIKDLSEFTALSEQEGAEDFPQGGVKLECAEFIGVSFKYPGTERYILKSCSFKLDAHTHYAFVGINGAGKTTITKLLTGLYTEFEGEIKINGVSIEKYKQAQLKAMFSVVYQDFARYYTDVKTNVKLGDVRADDDEKMLQAMRAIGIDELEPNLILGKIIEGGLDISGGQWQKLAIARSIYKNAPMTILDEPTAALDPTAESRVYELFGRLTAGKSAIFITHRLGAARLADEILVLEEGSIAERGSHGQLLEKGGLYAQMFKSQKSWYEEGGEENGG